MKDIKVASIFGRSGVILEPWIAAGCACVSIDIEPARHSGLHIQTDIRTLPPQAVDVLFAWPPCTHLSSSGARWWATKGPAALSQALELVDIALAWAARSRYWLIENPVGRLSTQWRRPDWYFNPCDYAGYTADPAADAYTKKTCIWGNIPKPPPRAVDPIHGSKMHLLPPGKDRAYLRSITPRGFSQAVFERLYPVVIKAAGQDKLCQV